MSRIRIFALFAVLFALANAFAACGGGDDKSDESPKQVIENASLEGVKSGELDLSLHVKSSGKEGGVFDLSLAGPFEAGANKELPKLQMTAKANGHGKGEKINFKGSLTLLTEHGYLEYEGDDYEIDPTTFGFIKSSLEQAQQQEDESASTDVTACQKAAEGIKFSQFAESLKNEGSADVEGTSTTKVSGDLNVSGAIDALIKLTEDPACSAQLEAAGPLPVGELEEAKGELAKAIKRSHVELYVGDDDIIRKMAMELTIEPPEAKGEMVELTLELSLAGVNEEQSFSAPAKAQPLQTLFQKLGIEPLELLEAIEGGGLEDLLEGLGSSAGQNQYSECLEGAETSADLQKCANLLN